jgi:hypothetical protein
MSDGFRRLSDGFRQLSRNLGRMNGQTVSITLPKDENGYIGRECPVAECEGYFKVVGGTGLTGPDLQCYCPYCGHHGDPNTFYTKEQIEYAKSVAFQQFSDMVYQEMKRIEFSPRPTGGLLSVGLSVKRGTRPPLRYYREQQLETEVECESCTLKYAIYGVFGFCPDCGSHNSVQILGKNLDLADKEITLASTVDGEMAAYLISDALENSVSAFDGFGRETCRVHQAKATVPADAENVSFQNLAGARQRVQRLFGYDLAAPVGTDDWDFACRCFQKRHLLAHKMGVVDDAYVRSSGDATAVVGRKVIIASEDVRRLGAVLRLLATGLAANL